MSAIVVDKIDEEAEPEEDRAVEMADTPIDDGTKRRSRLSIGTLNLSYLFGSNHDRYSYVKRVKATVTAKKEGPIFVESKEALVVLAVVLVICLFLPDVWTLANVENTYDPIINTILIICFAVFFGEMVSLFYWRKSYRFSFIFWIDVISTITILADMTWIHDAIFQDTSSNLMEQSTALRTARIAKFGGKLGRIARVAKYVFGKVSNKLLNQEHVRESVIANKIIQELAKRLTALIMLLILIVPSLFPSHSSNLPVKDPFLGFVSDDYSSTCFSESSMNNDIRNMKQAYNKWNVHYRPISLRVSNVTLGRCPTDNSKVSYEPNTQGGGDCVWKWKERSNIRRFAKREFRKKNVLIVLDSTGVGQHDSMLTIVLILIIVFLLGGFSASIGELMHDIFISKIMRAISTIQTLLRELSTLEPAGDDPDLLGADIEETDLFEILILKVTRIVKNFNAESTNALPKDNMDSAVSRFIHESILAKSSGNGINKKKISLTRNPSSLKIENLEILRKIDSDSFDVLDHELPIIETCVVHIFQNCFDDEFSVDSKVLANFAHEMRIGYHNEQNSYHNFYHGFDVLQTVTYMIRHTRAHTFMSRYEILACKISAIGHDLNHPGRTNAFLVNTNHELALLYNDKSPLENMHCVKLTEVLRREESDILECVSQAERKEIRNQIVECILHTDMVYHFETIAKMKNLYEVSNMTIAKCLSGDSDEKLDRKSVMLIQELFIHASDISNPVKPIKIYRKWVDLVVEEFFAQGDEEKTIGLTVSAMCDRTTTKIPGMQLGFMNFIVAPLYAGIFQLFPGHLNNLESNIEKNIAGYLMDWMEAEHSDIVDPTLAVAAQTFGSLTSFQLTEDGTIRLK